MLSNGHSSCDLSTYCDLTTSCDLSRCMRDSGGSHEGHACVPEFEPSPHLENHLSLNHYPGPVGWLWEARYKMLDGTSLAVL